MADKPKTPCPPEQSPVAWFVMLENARVRNDFEGAANAVRKLRALGVDVRYRPTVEGARQ